MIRNGKSVNECPPSSAPYPPMDNDGLLPEATYILAMMEPEQMRRSYELKKFLEAEGFRHVRVYAAINGSRVFDPSRYTFKEVGQPGSSAKIADTWYDTGRATMTHRGGNDGFLTLGERGCRESMRGIIETASLNRQESIMVLEYDVVLHCQFKKELIKMLLNRRCGAHVVAPDAASGGGGVLMLGASIYSRGDEAAGWGSADAQLARSHGLCFNVMPCMYGAFANIYHRDSYRHILDILNDPFQRPFDHIYMPLARRSVPVRVAYPFLAVADVLHASSTDNGRLHHDIRERLNANRWNASTFCKMGTDQLFYNF